MASLGAVKPLRSTGCFERYNITRNFVKFYTNVGATVTYNVPSKLFEPEAGEAGFQSVVLTALGITIQRHAPLGIGIKGEGTPTPEWIRLGENKTRVKWSEVVKFLDISEEEYRDENLEEAHSQPFERVDELPIWRASVTKRSTDQDGKIRFKVGFYFHHAIGDGISGGAFHNTFREAMNSILEGKTKIDSGISKYDEILFSPNLELLPNMERAHPLPLTLSFIFQMLIQNFVYKKEDPTHWKGPLIRKTVVTEAPITRLKSFSLDKDTTAKLVHRCREEKTSLTSLMTYLVARKMETMYPDYNHFTGLIPFSFRRFTNTSNDEITLQVTTNPIRFTRDPNDPEKRWIFTNPTSSDVDWPTVRYCKKTINECIKSSNQLVGMLKWVRNIEKYMYGKLNTKRDASFEVSNIGVIDGGIGSEGVCFEKLVFSACIPTIGAAYSFDVASVKGGDMVVVLHWEEGMIPRGEAEDLLGGLEGDLRRLAALKLEV